MKTETKKSKPSSPFSRVKVLGEGLDELGNRYIKVAVVGSDRDIPPFSVKQLVTEPKPLFAELGNAGWNVFTSKSRHGFLEKLQNRKPHAAKFKVVTQLGWNSGAYVFPDEIVGEPNEPLERSFGHLDPAMLSKYRVKPSLKEWQDNVAALCVGNSRLMFSVSLAFTGPILRFVQGPKSGGFQIYGPPETSKTTAAIVAGSVWGCHRSEGRREKGFLESWNTTGAKAELTALAHNDAFLVLDETKTAGGDDSHRAKVVTEVIFKLAEHVEKERLTNQQSARAWREYFLSTSNLSLAQLAVRGKIGIDEADRGRLADIPLPKEGYGIYEELHGFADGAALCDALQRRSRRYFGTAARKFVRRVVRASRTDRKALKAFLAGERKTYSAALKSAAKAENLRPLNRVMGRSATAFAAGSLAIKYSILPWDREKLLQAVLSCELDHLRHTKEDDLNADPVVSLRSKLVKYLNDHHAKFMNLKTKQPKLGRDKLDAVPGYRAKFKRRRWYYLTADQLKAIIGVGLNAVSLKRQLAGEGLLAKASNDRFVVDRPIFTGGRGKENWARVHAIKAAICREGKANG
jgi:hypothetical protein